MSKIDDVNKRDLPIQPDESTRNVSKSEVPAPSRVSEDLSKIAQSMISRPIRDAKVEVSKGLELSLEDAAEEEGVEETFSAAAFKGVSLEDVAEEEGLEETFSAADFKAQSLEDLGDKIGVEESKTFSAADFKAKSPEDEAEEAGVEETETFSAAAFKSVSLEDVTEEEGLEEL